MTYDLRKRGNSDIDTYVGRRPREHETASHKPKAEPATGPPHSLRRSQPGRCLDLCLLATQIVVIGYGGPSTKPRAKSLELRRSRGVAMGFGWAPRELLVGRGDSGGKPERSHWKGSSRRAEGHLVASQGRKRLAPTEESVLCQGRQS